MVKRQPKCLDSAKISKKLLIPWDESQDGGGKKTHENEKQLPKGSVQYPKLDQLGGKDWNNLDGGV